MVAHKVVRLSRTAYRYEYAIYNMNSERGVDRSASPWAMQRSPMRDRARCCRTASPGPTTPGKARSRTGRVTWSTKTFQENENANAIRWGTTYNFWFETQAVPTQADADLGRFKPGSGPGTVSVKVQAPKG